MNIVQHDLMDQEERHASWLELFFDLVFVVSVSSLANNLFHQHTVVSTAHFVFLFLCVWWLWMGISYYADQFDVQDTVGKTLLFSNMFGIVLLNHFLPTALINDWQSFAMIYFGMRFLLIALYMRAYVNISPARNLLRKYIIGFAVGALFWFISIFLSQSIAFYVWILAMVIDLSTPVIAYLSTDNIPAQISHMDERFGLFVIIVLGETILDVSHSLQFIHWTAPQFLAATGGFLCSILFWHLYFSRRSSDTIHNALRGKKNALLYSFLYGYGHFFIFLAITMFGVGIELFIKENLLLGGTGFVLSVVSILLFIIMNKVIQKAAICVQMAR